MRPTHRPARLVMLVAAVCLAAPATAGAKTLTGAARDARIQELGDQIQGLRDQSKEVSGTPNPREGLRNLKYELAELKVRQGRLDEAIEDAEGTSADLAAYKKQFEDRSIFTAGDAVQEGGEKGVEAAARKKLLSKGAGRVLGWLGIAGDVGEYGGKWLLKQGDLDALEDALKTQRVNLHDLYEAHIGLSAQINDRLARIEKQKKIIAKDDELYPEYAKLREAKRLDSEPASKGAVLSRDPDAAGDEAERKAHSAESARRGISTVTKPRIDPQPQKGSTAPRGRY